MAGPMRERPGERAPPANNFEYDEQEWDVGIGDLIIDLDADIEKSGATPTTAMASSAGGGASKAAKLAVEHSATVDKGLKMKIKRTKPGTKSSEAKHEIVKSNEQNGAGTGTDSGTVDSKAVKHPAGSGGSAPAGAGAGVGGSGTNSTSASSPVTSSKRGSSSHRRDKVKDKGKTASTLSSNSTTCSGSGVTGAGAGTPTPVPDVNGVAIVRQSAVPNSSSTSLVATSASASPVASVSVGPAAATPLTPATQSASQGPNGQAPPRAAIYPSSSGPGPPPPGSTAGTMTVPTTPNKGLILSDQLDKSDHPPAKKAKSNNEPKEVADVCVGTSVATITEPDCLGPCEPGTSVTLEGIVWHETEGGVLVVNVTWRGKTYVGTLLDCTRHDWAPPRFCDSPTSDLDARTPKGRGKRGRAAANTPGSDLSNFTETRSSVHSKLRNGGLKGRRGPSSTPGNGQTVSSPTHFPVPRVDNKRKTSRSGDDDVNGSAKKSRSTLSSNSPPPSPVLLECPEPNCCKKYKNINGLRYHQSRAHGTADDEDTKDVASMSENDESNAEPPSPAAPALAKDKDDDLATSSNCVPESSNETAKSGPSPPPTPTEPTLIGPPPPPPPGTPEKVLKPGVLRFGLPPEESCPTSAGVFVPNKNIVPAVVNNSPISSLRVSVSTVSTPPAHHMAQTGQTSSPSQAQAPSIGQTAQPSAIPVSSLPTPAGAPSTPAGTPTPPQPSQMHLIHNVSGTQPAINKVPQFKVKPTSALMPEEKKTLPNNLNSGSPAPLAASNTSPSPNVNSNAGSKTPSHKKKMKKSPAGSPHPNPQPDQPFGMDNTGREGVQSPAYSDISDDAAPSLESEMVVEKSKLAVNSEKKVDATQGPGPPSHSLQSQYGMFPYFGQPPYLVSPVAPVAPAPASGPDGKSKEPSDKATGADGKPISEKKKEDIDFKLLAQHYPYYNYVPPTYPYNLEAGYAMTVMPVDEKMKEGKMSPGPQDIKPPMPVPVPPSPIQVPNPSKIKLEPGLKDKHQNENHQILKESIEIKNQMSGFVYSRPPGSQGGPAPPAGPVPTQPSQSGQPSPGAPPPPGQPSLTAQQQDEMRRYYLYSDQRRKDGPPSTGTNTSLTGGPPSGEPPLKATPPPSSQLSSKQAQPTPSPKHKDKEEKKEDKKQEGVKPTMETQGPPPPPTSSYAAYIHPGYMQGPHYGGLPFDPAHPVYRGMNPMLVPGPYLHPSMPRYLAPEDLSRPPPGPPKALDLLQHHANQYYTTHKIHELNERAQKSPTPKTVSLTGSPSGGPPPPSGPSAPPGGIVPPPTSTPGGPPGPMPSGKPSPAEGKDSRSPPPQRHVHTHHHTHVGLGYPILASQYPAPYGAAAVLASQQAAAVAASVISPFAPK